MAARLSTAVRNAAANVIVQAIDAGPGPGTLQLRTGAQPASADDPATGTLLATFTLADPAFGAAALGVATLDATPPLSAVAAASGTAGWFRVADSTGATVGDGLAGTSGQQLNLSTTAITAGGTVTITAGTATVPAST